MLPYENSHSIPAFTNTTVSRNSTSVMCDVVVTGGDFFLFHDFNFKNGWYYTDTDLHSDRVVIDERLAFELFGSNFAEDMTVTIGSEIYYVAGVVEYDKSRAKELQLGSEPMIFIPSHIADRIFGERQYDSYEIMMQNPVDSYAVNALAAVTEGRETVDVTHRFGLGNIFDTLKEFPTRSYRSSSITYPYWENAERGMEDILAVLLVVNALTAFGLVVNFIILIIERKLK